MDCVSSPRHEGRLLPLQTMLGGSLAVTMLVCLAAVLVTRQRRPRLRPSSGCGTLWDMSPGQTS